MWCINYRRILKCIKATIADASPGGRPARAAENCKNYMPKFEFPNTISPKTRSQMHIPSSRLAYRHDKLDWVAQNVNTLEV